MQVGDKVLVLGVINDRGESVPCTLRQWHPNPKVIKTNPGWWDITTEDGRSSSAYPDEIAPWHS